MASKFCMKLSDKKKFLNWVIYEMNHKFNVLAKVIVVKILYFTSY